MRSNSDSVTGSGGRQRWRGKSGDSGSAPDKGVRGWFRKEIGELFHSDAVIGDSPDPLAAADDPTNDFFMEQLEGDLR